MTADKRRVKQILINLINNAIKFTEKGGVTVDVKKQGDTMLFTVADTGIGIKQENIKNLFQPFAQLDTGIDRKYGGTGLGLSICKKLADLMAGTIEAESVFGRGSTFTVKLPFTVKGLN